VPENPGCAVICGGQDLVSDTRREPDREAEFARLVLCRRSGMLRAIWRVVRDPDLAEDALQDALTTLWRKLPALARHPNPDAFVLRVSLDAACDHLRSHMRRRRREVPLDAGEAVESLAQPAARDLEVLDEVLRAIGRLQRRQATAILLRAIHDESYETIARSLGCSEVTARVHVLRAREKLRRWLSHLCGASREEASR
jgi:RNA polymerase sigma-70 factor (ECF subfamily)